eukprot:75359-Amphidinium_carterae.1
MSLAKFGMESLSCEFRSGLLLLFCLLDPPSSIATHSHATSSAIWVTRLRPILAGLWDSDTHTQSSINQPGSQPLSTRKAASTKNGKKMNVTKASQSRELSCALHDTAEAAQAFNTDALSKRIGHVVLVSIMLFIQNIKMNASAYQPQSELSYFR